LIRKLDRPVQKIHHSRTVLDAVKRLVESNVGSILVENDEFEIVGIFTERDILRIARQRSHMLGQIPLSEVMTRELITAEPEDKIDGLLRVMSSRRVRHLPVFKNGRVVGLVSMRDIVAAQLAETEAENEHLKAYIQGQ
jgi:CBS domain-containing protein